MKRTTIKDLARQFGVNPSTISRALNNHPDVGEDLKNRVQALANQLGYRPNRMAASFRNRRSRLIGLIVPQINMFFFLSIIKGVEDIARAKGYSLIVLHSSDSLEREVENVQICFENNIDGLLVALTGETQNLDHFDLLREAETPIVFFDKIIETPNQQAVIIDDLEAAAAITDTIRELGCKRIIGVFGDPNLSITQKRLAGFERALAGHNAEVRIVYADSTGQSMQQVKVVLSSGFVPDALFAMSDEVLLGAVAAIEASQNALPKCRIVCFSDGLLPNFLNVQMTYVLHSGYEIGQTAMSLLVEHMNNSVPATGTKIVRIPTKIVSI
ncbi:MAG: LacI family DNA-binding transcriptional regulator [Saprospiraceae bacterium]